MDPGTIALLHSPLVGVESWGALPAALRRGGVAVLAARVDGDDWPPYAERYVARAGASRLDLLAEEDPAMAAGFRADLEAGGRFPTWTDADLEPLVPGPAARLVLLASLRPRGLAFFTEPLPAGPPGRPDAPCGYLHLSGAYDTWLERAEALGWPAARLPAGNLHALVDPDGLAGAMLALLARL